jgi:hypothetical protein
MGYVDIHQSFFCLVCMSTFLTYFEQQSKHAVPIISQSLSATWSSNHSTHQVQIPHLSMHLSSSTRPGSKWRPGLFSFICFGPFGDRRSSGFNPQRQGYAFGLLLAGSLPALAVIPATKQIIRKVWEVRRNRVGRADGLLVTIRATVTISCYVYTIRSWLWTCTPEGVRFRDPFQTCQLAMYRF